MDAAATAQYFKERGFNHRSDTQFTRWRGVVLQAVELLVANNGKWVAYTAVWVGPLMDTAEAAYVSGELADWGVEVELSTGGMRKKFKKEFTG